MLSYYPPITPYAEHKIAVRKPHVLYVEESGNPKGLPILFVHGGPGVGCSPDQRRFFDPEVYRIILFDQRGCGQSIPHADLTHNTTQELVNDMEVIRQFLKIDQWALFGGSWGSTLSLVYAQTYPKQVLGLIVRGIFLAHDRDMQWFFQDGANRIYPDYWEEFIRPIPEDERNDLIAAYYKRLTGENDIARMAAAKAWAQWEAQCVTLQPRMQIVDAFINPHSAISIARIECHYFMNQCFLQPNQILQNMPIIEHIPGIIVHGRYDIICTMENAWQLHKAWPASKLHIVPDGSHAASESSMTDALIHATKMMAQQFSK